MISNIGGTLGLFCGFSLLSGVEAIYWAAATIADKLSYYKKSGNNRFRKGDFKKV